jgi:steroid delta-isomerase-like uncharacterized protein
MSEQDHVQIIRKIFDLYNAHNLDGIDQYLAGDVRTEATGATGMLNKEQTKMYNRRYLDAFPDLHFDLRDVIAQDEKVAVAWVAKGSHTAPLVMTNGDRIPATQRMVTVAGHTFCEFKNNLVFRQQILWDQVSFLMQLGLVKEQELISRMGR